MGLHNLCIVAVDDEVFNLELLREISSGLYPEVLTFSEPMDALSYLCSHHVDILLVDYMMPQMNGIELMQKALEKNPALLTVMITAAGDDEKIKIEALNKGAIDFLKKPLVTAEYRARMNNLSRIKASERILDDFNRQLKTEVEHATKMLVQREKEALRVLSNAAEYKDPETASHVARVAHYSKLLAKHYGLDETEQEIIFYASPLHDIGKVGISDQILLKPGRLDAEENSIMQGHCEIGWKILESSENPYLKAGAVISYTHHEKFDGSGYPRGLKGEDIHLYGRITAIADVFDALTSHRPYKEAWPFDEALEYLKEQSGKHFDPALCELFFNEIDTVRSIYNQFKHEKE